MAHRDDDLAGQISVLEKRSLGRRKRWLSVECDNVSSRGLLISSIKSIAGKD